MKKLLSMLIVLTLLVQVFTVTSNEIYASSEVVSDFAEMKDALRPHLISTDTFIEFNYSGTMDNFEANVSTMINELASEPEIYGLISGVSYGYGGSIGNMTVQFNFTYNEVQTPNENAATFEEMKDVLRPHLVAKDLEVELLYTGSIAILSDSISTMINELVNEAQIAGTLTGYSIGQSGVEGNLTLTFTFTYATQSNPDPEPTIDVVADFLEMKDLVRVAITNDLASYEVLYTGDTSNLGNDITTMINELANETALQGRLASYGYGTNGTSGDLTITLSFEFNTEINEGASTMLEVKELLRPSLINRESEIEFTFIGTVATLQAELGNVLNELTSEEPLVNTVNQFGTSLSGVEGNLTVTLSVVYQGIDSNVAVYADNELFIDALYNDLLSHPEEVKIGYHSESFNSNTIVTMISEAVAKDDYLKQSLTSYSTSYMRYGYDYEIVITPTFSTTSLEEIDLENRIDVILDKLLYDGMSVDLKEKVIHDYIVKNILYDDSLNNTTAYDALISGKTTCNGYSMLSYKMLTRAGIDTRIITGSNHAWNMVNIDGDWYHLDGTGDAGSYEKDKYYTYYNITDTEMSKMASWEESFPAATEDYVSQLEISGDTQKGLLAKEISAKRSSIGLDILMSSFNIQIGKVEALAYTYSVPGNYSSEIVWTSSNENVVSTEENELTAITEGSVIITAQTTDGRYIDQCQVNSTLDYQSNNGIHIDSELYFYDENIVMSQGDQRSIYSALIDFTGLEKDLVWISDNPYAVTVKDGVIYANGEGVSTVAVYGDGELVDECEVTVLRPEGYDNSTFTIQSLSLATIQDMNTVENTALPSIEILCDSAVDINSHITVVNKHEQFDGMFSLIGQPFEIETDVDFEYADLTFSIDDSILVDQPINDLCVFWYDEITDQIILLDTVVDEENQTLSARVNHFSIYGVVNKETQRMLQKVSMMTVRNMLNPKRLDLSVIIDNKWSEDLDNAIENLMNTIGTLDGQVDLKLNVVVINRDSSVTDLGWFTNKSKYKYLGDYQYDVGDFDEVGDFVELYQQLLSIQSEGYDALQYDEPTISTASDLFTLAYNKAMNSSGRRNNSDTCGLFITEIDGYTYFEDVKNSIIEDNDGFGIIIQQASNQLFDQYGETTGQDGVYSDFSEPVVDFVADKVSERNMYQSFYLKDFNFYYYSLSSLVYPRIEPILVSTGNNYIVYSSASSSKYLVAKQSYNIDETTLHLSTDEYYSAVYEINDNIVTPYHFMGQIFKDYSNTLSFGNQNDDVEVLKTMLVEQGLIELVQYNGQYLDKNDDVYQVDQYDTLTKQTVKYLQMIYGLNVNGVTDNKIWTLLGLPEPESEYYKYILEYVSPDPWPTIWEWLLMTEAKGNFPSFTVDRMMNLDSDKIFVINTLGSSFRDIIPRVYFKKDGMVYDYRADSTFWEENYVYNMQNHGDNYKSYDMNFSLVTTENGYEETIKTMTVEKHVFGDVNLTVYSSVDDGESFHKDPLMAWLGETQLFVNQDSNSKYSSMLGLKSFNTYYGDLVTYQKGKIAVAIVGDVLTTASWISFGASAPLSAGFTHFATSALTTLGPSTMYDLEIQVFHAQADVIYYGSSDLDIVTGMVKGLVPGVSTFEAIRDYDGNYTGAFVSTKFLYED